ncbi:MAG: NADH-quinone oxidoreductase subunit [Chloroflexi bacterium]|nr:NADH-quinone oxidoreductase subunit [Chloroflexota bacterium]
MTFQDLVTIAPLAAAILLAAALVAVDIAWPGRHSPVLIVSLGGLAIIFLLTLVTGATDATAFGGAYKVDALTTFLDGLFVLIVAFTIVFGPDYLAPRRLPLAEFAIVLVFAMTGAMLLAASADLLVLFIGLELMILPGYLLAGYHKSDGYSTEGAIKYFLLGSFSSAIFLFGLAFVWGLTGTTRVAEVAEGLAALAASGGVSTGLALGLAFMTTGVAFKIAAVPFHYWTPDAYQGSPTPVTGYLSVGPKIGAFALILRLFAEALGPLKADWLAIIVVLAVLTMTLGNLVALTQTNVKRMLAYSSIAHTGYMLVGLAAFAAGRIEGLEGLIYYGAAYSFMNLGAFAVIAALQKRAGVTSNLDTFAGLGRREPWLGILMTLFLLSLTGIPPTAGFFAKALVILPAVQASQDGVGVLGFLAVITVLNAAAAAFYYLRVVVYMFMREPSSEEPALSHGRLLWGGRELARRAPARPAATSWRYGVTVTPGRICERFSAIVSGPMPPSAPARMIPSRSTQKWTGSAATSQAVAAAPSASSPIGKIALRLWANAATVPSSSRMSIATTTRPVSA